MPMQSAKQGRRSGLMNSTSTYGSPIQPEPYDERDGTLARDDQGRYVIAWSRHLTHSPERVWRAITEQAEVGVWARGSWAFEPRVGGSIQLLSLIHI